MQFRYYLDSIEELISYYDNIDEPYAYIKMTPSLFNRWSKWARVYKPIEQSGFREFGSKISPDWARSEFKDLEDFYQYYINLVEEK